ncbi:endonuclease [Simiduia sp. 21SJ11W-1]|uniref:endonuclease n=1 Tax=Simiduia sp. 21SJ11W-1 TaxID=2909669 RepID=UPI0020A02CDF|nr:endonuclease [Simiduia sp. 21SJ11W-1]UTA48278.1 endonuclease [Simiduia sp. 21SJ11W-1]
MKRLRLLKCVFIAGLLGVPVASLANVINGDFETWSGSSPDGWTTIDSGISVTKSTAVVHSGSAAAAVNVTTGSQSSTDFRQSVSVSAGETYDFSVWVQHTEGRVKARLYVDGYQGYSDNGLINQWQQLSHSYTATFTGTIEVGLRFYDQSGFDGAEVVYLDDYTPSAGSGGGAGGDVDGYYNAAQGLSGYALKTALHNIIKDHNVQGYSALWGFYAAHEVDNYYEQDGSILDIYSENPSAPEAYTYTAVADQCGSYSAEGHCYNREHSFPRSWFGGAIEPMNSDVHHIFATDGYVNALRGSYPFGEVASVIAATSNGSRLGDGQLSQGYTGVVFEPIDEFKGDVARAYFYMATRYENVIGAWASNSSYSDAVLDGSGQKVFETWMLYLLIDWHKADPVSQKEIDRNNAAHAYQGNRNPFIDHPEYVQAIWGH